MKKILTSVICAALATVALVSCSSNRYDPNSEVSKKPAVTPLPAPVVYEVPEEEQVFTVEKILGTIPTELRITEYTGDVEDLVIPEKLQHPDIKDKCLVTEIGETAFMGNETLKSVTLPKAVKKIGASAFQSCVNLTTVNLYNGETVVEEKTNEDGTVETVETVIPANLEAIGDSAFHNTALTEITIPDTVNSIGFHAFSDQFKATPWYDSLKGDKVIVGDGILLKTTYSNIVEIPEASAPVVEEKTEEVSEETAEGEAEEAEEAPAEEPKAEAPAVEYVEYDCTDVKHIAYYAFNNPGAVAIRLSDTFETIDRHAIFASDIKNNQLKFLVPFESEVEKYFTTQPYVSEAYGKPAPAGNPFTWEFNAPEDLVDSWYGGGLDISFARDGSMHGVITNGDPQVYCYDKINIPTDSITHAIVRMKHHFNETKTDANAYQYTLQIYYDNGTGLSEGSSQKVNLEQSSGGQYVEYTLDMKSSSGWRDVIKLFRIDTGNGLTGEVWIDSVQFFSEDPEFDYGTLLKPFAKAVPEEENPYKFKFAEKALADAWTTSGMEYSYDSETETISGVVAEEAQPEIVSPALDIPGVEYRSVIVRMKHDFTPVVAEEAVEVAEETADETVEDAEAKPVAEPKKFTMTLYFDNGEGYSEERAKTVDLKVSSDGEKVEYTFDMCELDGWYNGVKEIKIALGGGMTGNFAIDKIEFVPENKLTRA